MFFSTRVSLDLGSKKTTFIRFAFYSGFADTLQKKATHFAAEVVHEAVFTVDHADPR